MTGIGERLAQCAASHANATAGHVTVTDTKLTDQFPPGMQAALLALHGPHKPLSPAERAQYDSQRAAEMARAEARRQPAREADLLDEAA